jgi:hypothetical protein
MHVSTNFLQKSRSGATLQIPPFRSVLLPLQSTYGQEKSRRVVVRSPAWCRQHSIQNSAPGCGECRGWQVQILAHSLALSQWTAGAAPIWASF